MAKLNEIWLIQRTARENNSDTDDIFLLEMQSGGERAEFRLAGLPHDEREQGRTDQYRFDVRDFEFDDEVLQPGDIRITATGEDAWLPSSFWVIGRNVNDGFTLLVARPNWPQTGWFSANPSDVNGQARPTRPLDEL